MASKQWLVEDYEAGDLPLTSGETLHSARLRYHRIGELNAPKDNLIMLPTYYGGAAAGNHPWVGGNSPLDPDRYCIVIPALLGAGESSSPSNTAGAQRGPGFPAVSLNDNVMLQKRLVEDIFGDARIALVMGWSMGGMQALQWGCLFPTQVRAVQYIDGDGRCASIGSGETRWPGDCSDTGPVSEMVYPGAPEIIGDGIDQNCDAGQS